ncbi:MAG: S26 family signal peptidase [Spirochaetaceae bacterium]|jgi:signal peptidase I|nr:S26 family signal peptidase [Spirochaetaceae bacterium]
MIILTLTMDRIIESTETAEAGENRENRENNKKRGTLRPARAVLGAFFCALLVKALLFDIMIVEGLSMFPVIRPGTALVVGKTAYGLRLPWSKGYLLRWSLPRAGDVVVFYTPHGEIAVKRCAEITDRGAFIALGDNRRSSYDSRSYGPVPIHNIIGKVLAASGQPPAVLKASREAAVSNL